HKRFERGGPINPSSVDPGTWHSSWGVPGKEKGQRREGYPPPLLPKKRSPVGQSLLAHTPFLSHQPGHHVSPDLMGCITLHPPPPSNKSDFAKSKLVTLSSLFPPFPLLFLLFFHRSTPH